MPSYTVELKPSARKELEHLSNQVIARITRRLDGLAFNPRTFVSKSHLPPNLHSRVRGIHVGRMPSVNCTEAENRSPERVGGNVNCGGGGCQNGNRDRCIPVDLVPRITHKIFIHD